MLKKRAAGKASKILRQTARIQQQLAELKSEHAKKVFSGTSANGKVTAKIKGDHKLLNLSFSDTDTENLSSQERSIIEAINNAIETGDAIVQAEADKLTANGPVTSAVAKVLL